MSTLLEEISEGLSAQGLTVEEDHGGLVVRGGAGNHSVTVWVDETERVVRAEQVLCYPVDDFSEELCVAMDQLNEARAGLTISFQEQQRALVAATVWSSPSRSPSPNQMHLLVALLHRAKERDGDALSRIADGEATWSEVAGELLGDGGAWAAPKPTQRLVSPEPPTRAMGSLGEWVEPPTRAMSDLAGGPQPASPAAAEGGPRGRDTGPRARPRPPSNDPLEPPVRKTSRLAFQMAINAAEPKGPATIDMTAAERSLGRRLGKGLFWLALIFGGGYFLLWYIVKPVYPGPFNYLEGLLEGQPIVVDVKAEELARRRAMPPGEQLLALEVEEQLDPSEDLIRRSLAALGEKKRDVLESLVASGAGEGTRRRAYTLWRQAGFHELEGARLGLVMRLKNAGRPDDAVVTYLANDLRDTPVPEAEAMAALDGAPPEVWRVLLTQLGRPGDGAAQRAAALTTQLPKETEDVIVLRALIETGLAPEDALSNLLAKRGLEWARGDGRALALKIIQQQPQQAGSLLKADDQDLQAYAVDLLTDVATPEASEWLLKVLKDRQSPMRTRLAATQSVRKLGLTAATWSLVLVVCNPKSERQLKDAALRALERIRGEKAVAELRPYLEADKPYNVRHYAVLGLGVVQDPSAVQVLVEMLQREQETRVRRLAAKVLEDDYLKSDGGRSMLNRGLAVFREVARTDPDASVRKTAQLLYDSLTGG